MIGRDMTPLALSLGVISFLILSVPPSWLAGIHMLSANYDI